ncbi:hypothetical protein GGX14DRAFT_408688 [Mycena pura]|uniref:Uncharacterized protein n=1 Tax=Mycena pura TaxID=153505 RepID=A0AAD6UPN6_9AGAR|nr:hypothetical protein GGX14DRAFT_408688 [Mycena pura]
MLIELGQKDNIACLRSREKEKDGLKWGRDGEDGGARVWFRFGSGFEPSEPRKPVMKPVKMLQNVEKKITVQAFCSPEPGVRFGAWKMPNLNPEPRFDPVRFGFEPHVIIAPKSSKPIEYWLSCGRASGRNNITDPSVSGQNVYMKTYTPLFFFVNSGGGLRVVITNHGDENGGGWEEQATWREGTAAAGVGDGKEQRHAAGRGAHAVGRQRAQPAGICNNGGGLAASGVGDGRGSGFELAARHDGGSGNIGHQGPMLPGELTRPDRNADQFQVRAAGSQGSGYVVGRRGSGCSVGCSGQAGRPGSGAGAAAGRQGGRRRAAGGRRGGGREAGQREGGEAARRLENITK